MSAACASEPLRIALSGCGHAGMNHGQEIVKCPAWRLVAVCDVMAESAAAAAARFGGVPAYTDYQKMLDTEKLDAVAIITPGHVHVPKIVAAAKRGVHAFSEKPLGITVRECQRAVAACRKAGVLLGVTYTYHFVSDFRRMRQIVDAGEIGAVREVRWFTLGGVPQEPKPTPPPPVPANRILGKIPHLFDCGVHAFDLMCWFAGAPVVSIKAQALAAGPGWEPSAVTIVFMYAGGQRGTYELGPMTAIAGCDQGQPAIGFHVIGTRGTLAWDFRDGWRTPREQTRIYIHTPAGSRVESLPVYSKCRDVQYAEFAQAVRDGKLPPHWPTPEQAVEATRMGVEAVAAVKRGTVYLTEFGKACGCEAR